MKPLFSVGAIIAVFLSANALAHDSVYSYLHAHKINQSGKTTITGTFNNVQVSATIIARKINIGTPAHPNFQVLQNSSCSPSTYPCLVVNQLKIRVRGQDIAIPRLVYCDLGSVISGDLFADEGSEWILIIWGGDGIYSYNERIIFNSEMVTRMVISHGLGGQNVTQETNFYSINYKY